MNDHEQPRRRFSSRKKGWIIGAGVTSAMAVLVGSGVAAASTLSPSASSDSATTTATISTTPFPTPTSTAGSQPRSGPADGGVTGIIESTSTSGFTISTWTGADVTVDETSATKIVGGPKKDVRKGESVLVLGLVDAQSTSSTSITAAQVDVQQHGDGGAKVGQKDGVEPATPGTPGPTKSVGTIPAGYTQGEGTIVSGAKAYAAVKAAQAVFPGGVVDRVVELANGDYEVHNIAVAWPHHVFVTPNYKVMGAND